MTTRDDQSGSPAPAIWLRASISEDSGLIFRKNATEPLVTSKSASSTRLPDSLLKAKAVWQASVEAPEPGFELEKTSIRPRSVSERVDGFRKRMMRASAWRCISRSKGAYRNSVAPARSDRSIAAESFKKCRPTTKTGGRMPAMNSINSAAMSRSVARSRNTRSGRSCRKRMSSVCTGG